jgi:hypothetical protein
MDYDKLSLFFDMDKLPLWRPFKEGIWERKMSEFDQLAQGSALSTTYNEAKMAHMPNMKERLELAVVQAEARLKDAKRAKEIFEKHPELEELLNIMQRGHF